MNHAAVLSCLLVHLLDHPRGAQLVAENFGGCRRMWPIERHFDPIRVGADPEPMGTDLEINDRSPPAFDGDGHPIIPGIRHVPQRHLLQHEAVPHRFVIRIEVGVPNQPLRAGQECRPVSGLPGCSRRFGPRLRGPTRKCPQKHAHGQGKCRHDGRQTERLAATKCYQEWIPLAWGLLSGVAVSGADSTHALSRAKRKRPPAVLAQTMG